MYFIKIKNISFFKKNKFIYLFLAVLGLCCCTGISLVVESRGPLSSCDAWASHCNGFSCYGAQVLGFMSLSSCDSKTLEHRLNSCSAPAQLLCNMWDLSGSGIEPVSPALAGGFFTTEPPGKPPGVFFLSFGCCEYHRLFFSHCLNSIPSLTLKFLSFL